MKKQAVIIVRYEEERDLNAFLSENGAYLEVSAIYEDVDATDVAEVKELMSELYHKEEND